MSAAAKEALIAQAAFEGFSQTRVTTPDAIPNHPDRLRAFLEQGRHGTMDWMDKRVEWRGDPATLWPQAKSCLLYTSDAADD